MRVKAKILSKITLSLIVVLTLIFASACGNTSILGLNRNTEETTTEEQVETVSLESTENSSEEDSKETEKESESTEETITEEPTKKKTDISVSMGDIITNAINGINPGDTAMFRVSVSSGGVTWLVSGNSSRNTVINSDGEMTVAWDEESKELTVTAVSNENINVTVAVNVEIIQPEPETVYVEVTQEPETVYVEVTQEPETVYIEVPVEPETVYIEVPVEPETTTKKQEPETTKKVEQETKHTHSYTARVVKKADCANDGKILYSCNCGDYYYESIPATGEHEYTTVKVEPTCTEGGYTLHRCTVCYDSYKTDETPSLGGHIPVVSVEGDKVVTRCSRCNKKLD